MPGELPHGIEPALEEYSVNRRGNITCLCPGTRLAETNLECLLCRTDQFLCFFGNLPHRNSDKGIGVEIVIQHTTIERDDISLFQSFLSWNPMDADVVDRGAERRRIVVVPLEGWLPSPPLNKFFRSFIKLDRRDPRAYEGRNMNKTIMENLSSYAERFDLLRGEDLAGILVGGDHKGKEDLRSFLRNQFKNHHKVME